MQPLLLKDVILKMINVEDNCVYINMKIRITYCGVISENFALKT